MIDVDVTALNNHEWAKLLGPRAAVAVPPPYTPPKPRDIRIITEGKKVLNIVEVVDGVERELAEDDPDFARLREAVEGAGADWSCHSLVYRPHIDLAKILVSPRIDPPPFKAKPPKEKKPPADPAIRAARPDAA